jgi:hypothetical protein
MGGVADVGAVVGAGMQATIHTFVIVLACKIHTQQSCQGITSASELVMFGFAWLQPARWGRVGSGLPVNIHKNPAGRQSKNTLCHPQLFVT